MHAAHYFEDLSIGQTWTSARRTVTESDVVIFAGMTGDYDRAHVDHDYASKSRFKQPLMHGMMGMAWVAGLSTTAPAVKTLALVSVEQWKFLRPVYIGDTVHVVTEVVELAAGGRSAGRVTWKKSLVNQNDEEVQSGLFVSLVELTPRVRPARLKSEGPHFAGPLAGLAGQPAANQRAANQPAASQPTEVRAAEVGLAGNGGGPLAQDPPAQVQTPEDQTPEDQSPGDRRAMDRTMTVESTRRP
jgi:acyl dehydratase